MLLLAQTAVCGQSCIIETLSARATGLDGPVMFCESMRDFRAHHDDLRRVIDPDEHDDDGSGSTVCRFQTLFQSTAASGSHLNIIGNSRAMTASETKLLMRCNSHSTMCGAAYFEKAARPVVTILAAILSFSTCWRGIDGLKASPDKRLSPTAIKKPAMIVRYLHQRRDRPPDPKARFL